MRPSPMELPPGEGEWSKPSEGGVGSSPRQYDDGRRRGEAAAGFRGRFPLFDPRAASCRVTNISALGAVFPAGDALKPRPAWD